MVTTDGAPGAQRTLLARGPRTTVYVAPGGDGPIVLKVLNADDPTPYDRARFQNELQITHELRVAGTRRALRKDRVDGRHALVLEYVPGSPIEARRVGSLGEVQDFLRLAIQIAHTLGELHGLRIVHKDIKPRNLIHDPATDAVTIIDFGVSARVDLKTTHLGNPRRLEGTLAYISPEQTGRMNRVVDHRADLYSLGATFYEMLTGHPPFSADDPVELVHAHIARAPTPPHHVAHAIPEVLGEIVLKLLAKDADDRYESAFGLERDLQRCQAELQRSSTVPRFALASRDHSGRLQSLARLYGREAEVARLLESSRRVAAGAAEMILVTGRSGVGKSEMVHVVLRALADTRGFFVEGKFAELQRSVPNYGPLQAFRALVDLLLTEDEAELAAWKERILAATGRASPRCWRAWSPTCRSSSASSRRCLSWWAPRRRTGSGTCSTPSCAPSPAPTGRWSSSSTTCSGPTPRRSTWSARSSPITASSTSSSSAPTARARWARRTRWRRRSTRSAAEGVRTEVLHLGDLTAADVAELTADTLRASREESRELAELVYDKTKGTAFFVRRLLGSLEEQGLLVFDYQALRAGGGTRRPYGGSRWPTTSSSCSPTSCAACPPAACTSSAWRPASAASSICARCASSTAAPWPTPPETSAPRSRRAWSGPRAACSRWWAPPPGWRSSRPPASPSPTIGWSRPPTRSSPRTSARRCTRAWGARSSTRPPPASAARASSTS